jgi:hypothetical protein
MNITKGGEHMIKKKKKEHNLPTKKQEFLTPLQMKILMFLATHQPLTMNETVTAIKGNYRSSWDAFKELEKKNLIQEVSQKTYRGREYPRYWASESGILLAYSERANPDVLLRKTQEIYPEKKELQFLIEMLPLLGESTYDMAYMSVVTNGKISQTDLTHMFSLQEKLSEKTIKKYNEVLKKYPERYKQQVDYMKQVSKNLKELLDMYDA